MAAIDPESTAFQRSEAWQVATHGRSNGERDWQQRWVPYAQIADSLKRAVIASEDSEFIYHQGVEWEAIERPASATPRPRRSPPAAPPRCGRGGKEPRARSTARRLDHHHPATGQEPAAVRASAILLRKGQELVLANALAGADAEQGADPRASISTTSNGGEGIRAEAVAQHYFRKLASRLGASEAVTARRRCCRAPSSSSAARDRPISPAARRPSPCACRRPNCLGGWPVSSGLHAWVQSSRSWGLLTLIRLLTGAQARWWGCPPKAEQRIYFANHQSHLDLVMIWAALPEELRSITRPIAARDYWANTPVKRWITTQVFNAIYVERSGGAPVVPPELPEPPEPPPPAESGSNPRSTRRPPPARVRPSNHGLPSSNSPLSRRPRAPEPVAARGARQAPRHSRRSSP